jgi:hypothetical protein
MSGRVRARRDPERFRCCMTYQNVGSYLSGLEPNSQENEANTVLSKMSETTRDQSDELGQMLSASCSKTVTTAD